MDDTEDSRKRKAGGGNGGDDANKRSKVRMLHIKPIKKFKTRVSFTNDFFRLESNGETIRENLTCWLRTA